ncbi:MAG: hypothetical protein Q8868_03100 [Bacteroidota bacterium]|nr:hypothetical protein [Bacteroidota bacterium]
MKTLKNVLPVILLIGLAAPVVGQQQGSDGKKVKSIIVYQEKHDMLVMHKYKDIEQYYDQRGNLIEDISYKQGKINKHFKYQYDSNNNKIREEEYDPSGRLFESSEYKYENGLRTEKIVYDPNKKIKSRKIYQYTMW